MLCTDLHHASVYYYSKLCSSPRLLRARRRTVAECSCSHHTSLNPGRGVPSVSPGRGLTGLIGWSGGVPPPPAHHALGCRTSEGSSIAPRWGLLQPHVWAASRSPPRGSSAVAAWGRRRGCCRGAPADQLPRRGATRGLGNGHLIHGCFRGSGTNLGLAMPRS